MKTPVRMVVALVVLLVAGTLIWVIWRPKSADADVLSGYVEGEALYLSAPAAGPVREVSVVRGQRVKAGDLLFAMDAQTLDAARDQAGAKVTQSDASAAQARASLAQLRTDAEAAHAAAATAATDAERYIKLQNLGQGAVTAQEADKARLNAQTTADQAKAADERLTVAATQIAQAEAATTQARAGLTDAKVRLNQLAPRAPGDARVEEVFFQAGEWAPANQPVVSLLPDAKVKLRFFVPEGEVAAYRPGTKVQFSCDRCARALTATIAYVSPRPEYTPPVIYSRKTRDKLVFLVEAQPTDPALLTPGLPVDVVPLGRPSGPAR